MEDRLNRIPGILTVGLFAHRPADILLIGNDEGVRELRG
jgi:ribose 5-phosphate isomerase A